MRILRFPFAALLALLLCAPLAHAGPVPAAPGDRLDHVLLWGRDIDQASAVLAAKLGFQVKPGRDPGGVANRYVRFADGNSIELLGFTRPDPVQDPGMLADQASLKGGPGARTFGIHAGALDAAHAALAAQGFGTTPVFSASPDDPDGAGPGQPPRWRLFAFDPSPLSSHLFFIDYAPPTSDPMHVLDDKVAREHPNGARRLSAFWLLSADPQADRVQLARMGFRDARAIRWPQLGAQGYCVAIGRDRLLLLAPDGPGVARQALDAGGPQILGISVGVDDLERARWLAERGYERPLAEYDGPFGRSVLAPTQADLGLRVEFHAQSGTDACAAD